MTKSNEEAIRKERAQGVITPKHKYFFPQHAKTVEAADLDEATKLVNKEKKDNEVGDGNS